MWEGGQLSRGRRFFTSYNFLLIKVADIDSSPSKEEEEEDDDTMQNTVVLFSNTDKFVLMQVLYGAGTAQLEQ